MEIKTKLTSGAAGILLIVTIVLSMGLAGQENVYVCLEKEIALVCDKLSAINVEGIQTRCYFNDGTKDTYKVCSEGWVKFENEVKLNASYEIKDYACSNETLVKECVAEDGSIILRVGV